jgi:hypothetical protein
VRQLAFDVLDTCFDEALLIFCSVVLGIFLEIAMRARLGNRLS